MFIQINTGRHVDGREALTAELEAMVAQRLERFASHLTRVEVHVRDQDGPRSGAGTILASVELRPAGRDPVVATDTASGVEAAVAGALNKAVTAHERLIGKATTRKGH